VAEHEDSDTTRDSAARNSAARSSVTRGEVTRSDIALPPPSARFTLASLMLIVTLSAVLFGVIALYRGIGIGLAVLSVPALVRTVGIQWRRRAAGAPLSPVDKGAAFLASLAVVTTITAASFAAFAAICFPAGLAAFGTDAVALAWFGWIVGIAAGLVVAYFLARLLWPASRTWHRGEAQSTELDGKDEP
jgi:hypothetical protein